MSYWGHPGQPGQPAPFGPPSVPRTNALAIASLVSAFLFAPVGIVLGHLSLSQIKRSGEQGRGLAIAGLVIGYVLTAVGVLAVVAMLVFTIAMIRFADDVSHRYDGRYPGPSFDTVPSTPEPLPPFRPPATLGANCQYPATTEPASKPVSPPPAGRVATAPPTIAATVTTNLGTLGLGLDRAKAPCTVNDVVSLARQGFYDGTTCHRLTTSPSMGTLQCGDPTGTGAGGPGYRFPNEYPTNQYRLADPALQRPVTYPRGTLAMANAGAGTNGSQFLLVYLDSEMPPSYTVFGAIDPAGLATVDQVAAAGVVGGGDDGAPVRPLTIASMRVS